MSAKNKISSNQRFLLELAGLDTKQEPDAEDDKQTTFRKIESVVVKTEIEEEEGNLESLFSSALAEDECEVKQESRGGIDSDDYQIPSPKSDTSDSDFEAQLPIKAEINYPKDAKNIQCGDCGKILSTGKTLRYHRRRFHPASQKEYELFMETQRKIKEKRREGKK